MLYRTLLRPKGILSISILIALLVLVACGAAATAVPPAAQPTAAPAQGAAPTAVPAPAGDTPSDAMEGGPLITSSAYLGFQTVDPNVTGDSATKIYYDEVFDYAIGQTPDGNLAPAFATKWEVSDDFLTWTFTIRDGMKFHNGADVTAEDVAWTWTRSIAPDSLGGFALEVGPMLSSGFTVVGNTVQVSTNKPESTLPIFFASASPPRSVVWPQAYFEEVGGIEGFWEDPIGSGPYMWEERKPGRTAVARTPNLFFS